MIIMKKIGVRSPRKYVFPTILEPGINALIHVTPALCHSTPLDSAVVKSSGSESDFCPFLDQKMRYCYNNGFLFHFGGSPLIFLANWILLNLRFIF